METLNETANKILDLAEHYTQTRGFNAFSYRDIQNDLGIKTASIHYYFPAKQDLALCMIDRYLKRYKISLDEISKSSLSSIQKLRKFADIFVAASKANKFCLCGMIAVDIFTMPAAMNKRLENFFQISEDWIAEVIREGIRAKNIRTTVNPEHEAAHYFSTLEGGLLIARVRKSSKYLAQIINELLKGMAT